MKNYCQQTWNWWVILLFSLSEIVFVIIVCLFVFLFLFFCTFNSIHLFVYLNCCWWDFFHCLPAIAAGHRISKSSIWTLIMIDRSFLFLFFLLSLAVVHCSSTCGRLIRITQRWRLHWRVQACMPYFIVVYGNVDQRTKRSRSKEENNYCWYNIITIFFSIIISRNRLIVVCEKHVCCYK